MLVPHLLKRAVALRNNENEDVVIPDFGTSGNFELVKDISCFLDALGLSVDRVLKEKA